MWTRSDSTSLRARVSAVAGTPSLSSRMTSSLRPASCQPLSSQNSSQPLYMSLPAWAMAPESGARKPILTGAWALASERRPTDDTRASETIVISGRMRIPSSRRPWAPRLCGAKLVEDARRPATLSSAASGVLAAAVDARAPPARSRPWAPARDHAPLAGLAGEGLPQRGQTVERGGREGALVHAGGRVLELIGARVADEHRRDRIAGHGEAERHL